MIMYGICARLVQLIFQLLKTWVLKKLYLEKTSSLKMLYFEKMQFDNVLPNEHKGSFVEMNICRSTCI